MKSATIGSKGNNIVNNTNSQLSGWRGSIFFPPLRRQACRLMFNTPASLVLLNECKHVCVSKRYLGCFWILSPSLHLSLYTMFISLYITSWILVEVSFMHLSSWLHCETISVIKEVILTKTFVPRTPSGQDLFQYPVSFYFLKQCTHFQDLVLLPEESLQRIKDSAWLRTI